MKSNLGDALFKKVYQTDRAEQKKILDGFKKQMQLIADDN